MCVGIIRANKNVGGNKMNYAHVKLYEDDFKKKDVWEALCKICGGDPKDEVLVINFEKGKAYTR